MKRFENAQVGDLVYCRRHGRGKITAIDLGVNVLYGLACAFRKSPETYNLDGFLINTDAEPMLFYIDEDNCYAEKRPKPPHNYRSVPNPTNCRHCVSLGICEVDRKFHFGICDWFKDKR